MAAEQRDATSRAFKDHFSDRAAGYAAHRPTYPSVLVDALARVAPGHALAWDAGCGSGQFSVLLAERFARVIATDASAEQLANAVPNARVEYRAAPAESSGLPDASADLVAAAQAAHWFDLDAFYGEVRRVARPGAVLALVSYGLMRVDARVTPVVRAFHSGVLGGYWPSERAHVDAEYRSLPFPFDEMEMPRLEIATTWNYADLTGYIETWSAVRALVKMEGVGPLDAFRRALADAWGDERSMRPVRFPLALRVGRV